MIADVARAVFRENVAMSPAPVELLFIQGARTGVHEADRALSDALGREPGPGLRRHFPRMPDEHAPDNDVWKRTISTALGRTRATFLAAHSAGGAIAADLPAAGRDHALSALRGVFVLAPPFVGRRGWPLDGFHLDAARLRSLPPLHLYFGLDDTTVPPAHAELYAAAFPDATIRRLRGCGHRVRVRPRARRARRARARVLARVTPACARAGAAPAPALAHGPRTRTLAREMRAFEAQCTAGAGAPGVTRHWSVDVVSQTPRSWPCSTTSTWRTVGFASSDCACSRVSSSTRRPSSRKCISL